MTSILERLDDLIRGSLHRFVDRALASNSLVMYDQDVRDMGSAINHLEEAAASMYAAARANERRLVRHQEEVEQAEQLLAHVLTKGEDATSERAVMVQAELDAKRQVVAETEAQIERQQAQYETLKKSVAETEVTAQTLKDARPRLESLLALTEAYRSIERVEMTLDALRGLGGDTEVALVADSIYQRFSEAEVRLDLIRRAESLEMLEELEQAEVEDQLAQRRRRLGMVSEPPAPSSPSAGPEETTEETARPEPSQPADHPDEVESQAPQPTDDAGPPESPPSKEGDGGGPVPSSGPDMPTTAPDADADTDA
jgi:phage shock protein A